MEWTSGERCLCVCVCVFVEGVGIYTWDAGEMFVCVCVCVCVCRGCGDLHRGCRRDGLEKMNSPSISISVSQSFSLVMSTPGKSRKSDRLSLWRKTLSASLSLSELWPSVTPPTPRLDAALCWREARDFRVLARLTVWKNSEKSLMEYDGV